MPTTSPVRVSGSSPARCATPKSVSFASRRRERGVSGTITFCGLTSRWMTPRPCACSSASASASPMRSTSRSRQLAVGGQAVERAPVDELRDQVARLVVLTGVEDPDDPGMVEPGGGERLARRPRSGRRSPGRDHLDGHLTVEPLVVGGVDRPEAARAEPRPRAGSGRARARADRAGSSSVASIGSPVRRTPRPLRPVASLDALPRRGGGACRHFPPRGDPPVLLRRGRRAPHERRRSPRPRRAPAGDVASDSQTLLVRRIARVVVCRRRPAAGLRGPELPRPPAGERAEGLQPPGLRDRAESRAGRDGVLPGCSARAAASPRRTSRTRSPASASRPSQQLKQAEALTSRTRCAARTVAADRARVAAGRPGLHRAADPPALGDSGDAADAAIQQIAGQMQAFLSSDVAVRDARRAVHQVRAGRQRDRRPEIARSQFLPALDWLSARRGRQQLGQQLSAGAAARDRNEPTGPGLHGTNIDSRPTATRRCSPTLRTS